MTQTLIIDFHTHMARYFHSPPDYIEFLSPLVGMPAEEFMTKYESPEAFLKVLDENGVDYAVVMAETSPLTAGYSPNEQLFEYCAASSRLIPFGTVNPYLDHRPDRLVRDLVEKHGVRGIKLYPTYQYFYPNDPMMYPIYAAARDLKIPVLIHTGSSVFKGARLKFGDPLFLDDVAVDFPDLVLLQSHGGRPFWYDRSYALCRFHENVYIDVAGLPAHKLLDYFPELERLSHKFVFGSDWPAIPRTIGQNIKSIRNLGLKAESVEKILGGNAARILGLKESPPKKD